MLRSDSRAEEQRQVRSYLADGVLDVIMGTALIVMGVLFLSDNVALIGIVPLAAAPLWVPFRHALVDGRSAEPAPGDWLERRLRTGSMLAAALGGLALVSAIAILLGFGDGSGFGDLAAAIPASILAVMTVAAAFVTGLRRMHLYAAVLIVSGLIVAGFDLNPGWSLIGSGTLVLATGATLAMRFVQTHPREGASP